jgi:hypothetical protein
MPAHDDAATKQPLVAIAPDQRGAIRLGQETGDGGATVRIEFG